MIPHSRTFAKFLAQVNRHRSLGTIVRRLDFSHFNPSALFSTTSERSQARNLTSETLLQCLVLTPHLQEFLAQEYIDDDLDAAVLRKLLFGLERLQALDFCGCSSADFKTAFAEVAAETDDWRAELTIKRLSLHKCITLPVTVLDALMPRLTQLTHLDVAGTRITDDALWSIPKTARLTHLNLSKCKLLSAPKELSLGRSLMLRDVQRLFVPEASARPGGEGYVYTDAEVAAQLSWVPHTVRCLDLSDMWGDELDTPTLFNDSLLLRSLTEPLEAVEFSPGVFKKVRKSTGALARYRWRFSEIDARFWLSQRPLFRTTPVLHHSILGART
ncbi:hypothetical protein RB593_001639 [Gaeumannomyces tritici]